MKSLKLHSKYHTNSFLSLNSQQTYEQWQIVFGILAGTYIFGSLAFLFMGTGEMQPWNNPPERNRSSHDTEEALPLKKDNVICVN